MTPLPEAQPLLALWGTGAAIVVLLVLSALISGSETALTAASRGRLHGLADRGVPAAGTALALTEDKERLTGAILLGSTLANALAASLSTLLFTRLFGAGGVAIAAVVMTALLVIFAELLPRTRAIADPEATALRVARPIALVVRLLSLQHSEGAAEESRDRLIGALDLGARQVEEVMMHRRDIEMIDAEAPPDAILSQAINSPHTRIPIFRGEPENIVGVIHAKDLSRAVHRFVQEHRGAGALEGFDIMDVAMPPYFVPESTPLDEQLREFLRRRTHFALVVDEYGALQGLVTLEDIIEEIVGDIADEHDVETPDGIEPRPDGSVEVEGGVTIRDLNRACDWSLPDEEANTIAGLVIHEAQAIPAEGQVFNFHGFRFEVLAREGNRLTRLMVRKLV
jgi:Mg2+/Co2+ transporter CorB